MIDVQALARGIVHHVERNDHWPAELAEFERKLEMARERRGIHHLDDHIRWCKRRRWSARFMRRNGWSLVAPQQVLQGHALIVCQPVERWMLGRSITRTSSRPICTAHSP